jgi:hypothetical protein
MFRSLALGGVAAAALSSGCCWRPFCYGPGPALYNPPPAPLFPRLHPSYWLTPPAAPAGPPALAAAPPVAAAPVGPTLPPPIAVSHPVVGAGLGYDGGGLPPGAIPTGAPYVVGGQMPHGIGGPVTVSPPPGILSGGPQYNIPITPAPVATAPAPAAGSTQLPQPKLVGDPPSPLQKGN